jgi:hypothetical protein
MTPAQETELCASLVAARGARVFLTVCACDRLRASFRPILSGVS